MRVCGVMGGVSRIWITSPLHPSFAVQAWSFLGRLLAFRRCFSFLHKAGAHFGQLICIFAGCMCGCAAGCACRQRVFLYAYDTRGILFFLFLFLLLFSSPLSR
ncbi:hypothetical protein IQ07DRAFT_361706 [Pyrenochaeta sp. DS3sAY3a]|nr:hypothetical protein IQ07DRAFT_361706 [Pyrenochaeta sp. DS3sAY3a]